MVNWACQKRQFVLFDYKPDESVSHQVYSRTIRNSSGEEKPKRKQIEKPL
jgi:hypothetical protein